MNIQTAYSKFHNMKTFQIEHCCVRAFFKFGHRLLKYLGTKQSFPLTVLACFQMLT